MSLKSRIPQRELKEYKHAKLMDDLNNFMVDIKVHLHFSDNEQLTSSHPKPTNSEIDILMEKLMKVLSEDNKPLICR